MLVVCALIDAAVVPLLSDLLETIWLLGHFSGTGFGLYLALWVLVCLLEVTTVWFAVIRKQLNTKAREAALWRYASAAFAAPILMLCVQLLGAENNSLTPYENDIIIQGIFVGLFILVPTLGLASLLMFICWLRLRDKE